MELLMIDYLVERLKENKKGLYVIQQATGSGKTFSVASSTSEYVKHGGQHRIIYLTTQLKNIDDIERKIKYIFKNDALFNEKVLRIESNKDCVINRLKNIDVPDYFKTDYYYALLEDIDLYNKNPKDKAIKKKLDEDERAFRRMLENEFIGIPDEISKIEIVENNDLYSWIGDLYPSMYAFRKQIILTSVSKFINGFTTIVGGNCSFIDKYFLKNSIIIIDEFDASKETLIKDILENPHKVSLNQIKLNLNKTKSYYESGFYISNIYKTFKEGDFAIDRSPEATLLKLCNMATVIGISATAQINTVVGNYNLDYLKEKLKDRYHETPLYLIDKNRIEYNKRNMYYKDINVECDVLDCNTGLKDYLNSFLDDNKADLIYDLIISLKQSDYINTRYSNLARVFNVFATRNDINSLLCFNSALATYNNPKFDIVVIKRMWDIITDSNHELKLYFLDSNNFDKTKNKILTDLSNGKKCLVMSTYKTIGAGQNLQYEIPNNLDTVLISEYNEHDDRCHTKDFDAVYFGDCTNLTLNTYERNMKPNINDLRSVMIQLYELYEHKELSKEEAKKYKDDFLKYFAGKLDNVNGLHNLPSIKNQATQSFIQAIGRINRTFCKNKSILLLIDNNMFKKLNTDEIKRCAYTHELQVVLNKLIERDKNA